MLTWMNIECDFLGSLKVGFYGTIRLLNFNYRTLPVVYDLLRIETIRGINGILTWSVSLVLS